MQLASFTVSNFRSITAAKKVPLTNYSVLVGANNEGKSNILHALALGMEAIEGFKHSVIRDRLGRIRSARPTLLGSRARYRWSHDFPISKQVRSSKDQCIEISFEFKLSDTEIEAFQSEIGSKLNGTLPVLVRLSRDDQEVIILKQGPGGAALNKNTNKIADFVSRNVRFEYIPAIRTSESAEDVISSLLSKELDRLENNNEYKEALSDRLRMGLQISAFVIHDVYVDTTDARPHGRDRAEDEALSDRSHRCRMGTDRAFAAPLFQAWTQAVG